MKNEVSKKIVHINFIFILMIVILHSDCLRFLNDANIIVSKTYEIITIICDAAVPSFFMLSAYLFYRNYDLSKIKDKYKSRFSSLVIPYLLWSVIFLIYYKLISYIPSINKYFNISFNLNANNIINNILMANCAEGMWFVRDLIIFTILAPAIYIILNKSKKLNYFIIFLCIVYNLVFDVGYSNPIFWLPVYLMGATFGIFYNKFDNQKNIIKGKRINIIYLISCFVITALVLSKFSDNSKVYYLYRVISPFILFSILDLFELYKFKLYNIERISFFIYCIHLPVIKIIRKILFIIFGYNQYISFLIYILTIIVTILVCYLFSFILKRNSTNLYNILTGERK